LTNSQKSLERQLHNLTNFKGKVITVVQISVRDNNVDQALKILKRKLQKEGLFKEIKQRRFYEKPSEKKVRKAQEAVRRAKKLRRMNDQ
jgi:small subunit ribosomal protein S21